MKLIDKNGVIYNSIHDFAKKTNVSRRYVHTMLKEKGYYENKNRNIKAYKYDGEIESPETTIAQPIVGAEDEIETSPISEKKVNSKLLQSIVERYSENELKLLSKGRGLQDRNLSFPSIHLQGEHHKIGVISDGHLGSKYSPEEFHLKAFQTFKDEGCECVLHCGDLVEGLNPKRAETQIYELSHIGYQEQLKLAVKVFSQCELKIYAISGNHDSWYKSMGADIVEQICEEVPNMQYLGYNQADIIIGGATIRLFHGGDGNSYALSYRMQKLAESFTSGKKPNILLAGHTHKMCYVFDRMIHCVSVPSLQMQTPWMVGKKIAAHTGFLIIEFDSDENGICNFQLKYYPFYA